MTWRADYERVSEAYDRMTGVGAVCFCCAHCIKQAVTALNDAGVELRLIDRAVSQPTRGDPDPRDLVGELRVALGWPDVALPYSAKQAWEECLTEVRRLRHSDGAVTHE
jgi:hypothetical protein